ncbi:10527_t:CDS:1, partial [Racocetra persica]
NGLFPFSHGHYAYRYYYVVSPKLVLVLCTTLLRKEFREYGLISNFVCEFFKDVPHPGIPKCVKINNERGHNNTRNPLTFIDSFLNSLDLKIENSDILTFPFVKVNSATVHLVNTIILNETKPDEVLSFLSHSNLYKTIVKYHKNKELDIIKQDHTGLKKKLFVALNRTHKENIGLRKNLSANYTYNWQECKIVQNSDPENLLRDNLIEIVQNSNPEEQDHNLTKVVQNFDPEERDYNLTKLVQNFDPEERDQLRDNFTEIVQNSNSEERDQLQDNLIEIVQNYNSEERDQLQDNLTKIVQNYNSEERDQLLDNLTNIVQNSDPEEQDHLLDYFTDIVQNFDRKLHDNFIYQYLKSLMNKQFHKLRLISPNPAARRWAIQEDVMRRKGFELNHKVNNKDWPNPYEQCLHKGPFDKVKILASNCG